MTFRIYETDVSATPLWSQMHGSVAVRVTQQVAGMQLLLAVKTTPSTEQVVSWVAARVTLWVSLSLPWVVVMVTLPAAITHRF